jgi:hypothetical protein
MNVTNKVFSKLFKENLNIDLIANKILKTVNLEDYPWDECVAEQSKKYDKESAEKICGYIKSNNG